MKKSPIAKALSRLLQGVDNAVPERTLFFEALESRVLYSAAPLLVEAPREENPVAQTVEVAPGELASQEPSATNPGSLTNALQAPEMQIMDRVEAGRKTLFGDEAQGMLENMAVAAAQRWAATGLTQEQSQALSSIQYEVRDLGGLTVAFAEEGRIVIDDDAGGLGWFVDRTPGDDAEFGVGMPDSQLLARTAEAQADVDLLTVLLHEQGHVLGLNDAYLGGNLGDLMYGGVEEGVRRLPAAGQAGGAVPGSLAGSAHADLLVDQTGDDAAAEAAGLTLREAINAAGNGDRVVLGTGNYILSQGEINVSGKDITIVGAGKALTTIDAQRLSRVFNISGGANVTFENLTITGGYVEEAYGGGIYHNGGTLTLTNVSIEGNEVSDTVTTGDVHALGGGLFNNDKTVIATNTDFINNKATRNGGDDVAAGGGFFANGGNSVTTMIGGTISGNDAREGGGFYTWSDGATITLDGVTITNNTAIYGAGFRFNSVGGTLNLRNGTSITNNIASSQGGGFYFSRGILNMNDGSTFTIAGNKVSSDGGTTIVGQGGGFYDFEAGVMNLANVTIENNLADEGAGFYVLRRDSQVNGTNVTIQNNVADVRGGGFCVAQQGSIVNLTNSLIDGNRAETEHGGGFYNIGTVTLANVAITNNTNGQNNGDYGAGFFNNLGEVTITGNSSIVGNRSAGYGGGFWNRAGVVTITGTASEKIEIQGNQTGYGVTSEGHGAGFVASDESTTNLTYVDFIGNISSTDSSGNLNGVGGGFYAYSAAVVNLANVNISNHSANEGGAFYVSDPQTRVTGTNVTLNNNTARSRGGAFRVAHTLTTVELTDSSINGNTVENEHGGGFYSNGTVTLTNTTVNGNRALDLDASVVTIDGVGNIAYRRDSYGGGFYNSGGTVNLAGTTSISDNDAYGNGGGFYTNGGVINATGTLIDGNEVVRDPAGLTSTDADTDRRGGGFISYGDGIVNLTDVTISNNKTGTDTGGNLRRMGGGFANQDGSTVNISGDSRIIGNQAEEGGAFWNEGNGSTVNITGTAANSIEIDGNVARVRGGGFRSTSSTFVNLTYVDLTNNEAGIERGGGFYADGALVTGSFVRIDGNHSGTLEDTGDEQGGGFWLSSYGKVTLTDSEVNGNRTEVNGGGFYNENGDVTLTRTTVNGNFAQNSGGGFMMTGSAVLTAADSSITNNIARDHGGGAYITDDTKAEFTRSLIGGNLAGYEDDGVTRRETATAGLNGANTGADLRGGGMRALGRAQVTVTDSTIEGNEASAYGGGFDLDNEVVLRLVSSTLAQNVSDYHGAGIRAAGGAHFFATNSTISNNYAGFARARFSGVITATHDGAVGGGFWSQSNTTTSLLNHVTVAENRGTSGSGAGIFRSDAGSITLENSIVFGNFGEAELATPTSSDTYSLMTLVGANVVGTHGSTGFTLAEGAYRITADPNLGALADNGGPATPGGVVKTHAITGTSVAAGAAIASRLSTDQLGNGRLPGATAVTTTVLDNVNGVDLQTDSNVTMGVRPLSEVGTSLRFGNGSADNETIFDVDVAPAGTFQAGDMVTVTVVLDYTRPEGDHDPSFILTDGTNSLTVSISDNTPSVDGNGNLFTGTMPATGGSSQITLTYSFSDAGNVIGASEGGKSDTNSGTTSLNAAAGLTFLMRGGNAGEDYQVDTISIRYAVVSGTSDIGAFEADPVATTLTLDEITRPENVVIASGDTVAMVNLGALATTSGAGPLNYDWTAIDPDGNELTVNNDGSANASFSWGPPADDPIQFVTVGLTVTDTTTGQLVISDVQQVRFVNPYTIPDGTSANVTVLTVNSTAGNTLRDHLNTANSGAGNYVIKFDASLNFSITGANTFTAGGTGDNNTAAATNDDSNANGDLDITKTNGFISIVGNGATETILNGAGIDRVFHVLSGSTVFFSNLTLTGGKTTVDSHGAGLLNEGGVVIMENVEVTGNSAEEGTNDDNGGGIFSSSSAWNPGLVFMHGGSVSNNSAEGWGGGIYMAGTNAGESLLYLDGTTISGNVASSAGGNVDDRRGGGLYFTNNGNRLVCIDVTVADNLTNGRDRSDGGGFAITGADHVVEITGGSFVRNKAGQNDNGSDSDGGGLWIDGTRNEITLTGVTFGGPLNASGLALDGNDAEDDGGAFYMEGQFITLNLVDVTIQGNTAGDSGGGFMVQNITDVVNITQTFPGGSAIIDNYSRTEHGGGFRNDGVVNITGSAAAPIAISGNQARDNNTKLEADGTGSGGNDRVGGGFYLTNNSTTNLVDVVMENNIANARGGAFFASGGAVLNFSSSVASTSGTDASFVSQIRNNYVVRTDNADGGGFYVSGANTIVNLTDVLVADNYATDEGGGFYSESNLSQTNLMRVDLVRNTAEDDGGGFYNVSQSSLVTMSVVLIDTNRSNTQHGGGFRNNGFVSGNLVRITNNSANDTVDGSPNTTLTNNLDRIGGGFYNYQGTVTLEDVIVAYNRAYSRGGGIFNNGGGIVTITSNTIRSRISDNAVDQDSDQSDQQWRYYGCGGGIYQESAGSTLNLTGVDITSNVSADDGGGICLVSDGSFANFSDVLIQANHTDDEGGGMMVGSGGTIANLNNVAILDNDTNTAHGGGISNRGIITGSNVIISGNKTGLADAAVPNDDNNVGGGIYTAGTYARIDITRIAISDNDAYGRGGGIYNSEGIVQLTDFVMSGNSTDQKTSESQGRGGAIWNSGDGDVFLDRGLVANNTSFGIGGGIYNQDFGSSVYATNVTISGNLAGWDPDANGGTGGFASHNAGDGGGIYTTSGGSMLILDHVTVANNQATRNGGGVQRGGGTVIYRNSILAGNIANVDSSDLLGDPPFASDSIADVTLEGSVVLLANQGGAIYNSERRITLDPNLGALADNNGVVISVAGLTYVSQTHVIQGNSVAAGAAVDSTVSQDQRGVTRIAGLADLGAFEADGSGVFSLANVSASPTTLIEGAAVTVTGDVIHALGVNPLGGDVYLTIDWGDGSDPYRATFPAGADLSAAGDFSASHSYNFGLDGIHTLRVSLADVPGAGPMAVQSFTVTVTDGGGVLVVPNWEAATNEDAPVTIHPLDPNPPTVIRTGDLLLPEDTALSGGNRMGWSVAIDGDLAVVGSEGQTNLEEVYVYRRNATSGAWELEQTLFNDSAGQFDDFGYSVAVNAANGRIFVGAELDDAGTTDKGAVYYFEYDGGQPAGSQWVMRQKIQGNAPAGTWWSDQYDNFGSCLAVSGGVLAVGARVEDADSITDPADRSGADDSGAVFIFNYNSGTNQYDLVQKLKAQNTNGTSDVGGGDQFGVSVAMDETGSRLVVGAELNDDGGSNSGSAYVYKFNGSKWVIEQKLSSPSENADDRFGYRVDISGDTIVVGARQDDTGGSNRGAAFIFKWDSGTSTWTPDQTLGSGITGVSNDDYFGGSVALEGNRLLVGAYLDDLTGKGNVGRAYLFERADAFSPFTFVKNLDSSDGAAGDQFGLDVAMSGDRYLIGARLADATVTVDASTSFQISQWGAAYIFEGSPMSAIEVAKLDGDLANKTDVPAKVEFGRRVAISGDYALVGAPRSGKEGFGDDARTGRAYLYQRDDHGTPDVADDTWTLIATLAPPTTDDDFDDYFGFAVDLSEDGSVVAVGAVYHEASGVNQGAVYVYERNAAGNGYELRGRIRAENRTDYDEFGRKIALSEDGRTLVVGMHLDDDGASNSGSVHIYDVTGSDWSTYFAANAITEQGILSVNSDGIKLKPISDKTTTSSDEFGMSVAISGNRIAVGAYLDDLPDDNNADNPSRNQGSAYLFERDDANLHAVVDPFVDQAQIAVHATIASGIDRVQIVTGTGLAVVQAGNVVTITLGTGGSSAASIVAAINSSGISGLSAELFVENGADDAPNDGSGVVTAASTTNLNAWQLIQKLVASNHGKDDYFGRSIALDGNVLVVGAFTEDSNTDVSDNGGAGDSGAAYVYEFNGSRWVETQRLKASDPAGSDQFGFAVAVDGNVIAVGAYLEDTAGSDAGSVYVYRRDAAQATGFQWQQTDLIRSPEGATYDQFGVSVDVSRGTVVVGAAQATRTLADGTRQVNFGAAYTYQLADPAAATATLSDLGELRLPDGTTLSRANRMGWSVAIDGDLAVVGSEGQNAQEEVYVYRYNGSSWDLETTLLNPAALTIPGVDPEQFDDFGYAVAVSDGAAERVFVGARLEDSGGTDMGRVYFYEFNPGTSQWELKQHIADGDAYDDFGSALATNGDTLVVGARYEDSNSESPANFSGSNDSGAVWVYTYNASTGQFDRLQKIKARIDAVTLDVQDGDQFGVSVAIDGDTIVVGQELEDSVASNAGAAYVYVFNPTSGLYEIQQKLNAGNAGAEDRFGYSVDISGDSIAVGARLEDTGGGDTGSVYIFTRTGGTWTQVQQLGDAESVTISDFDYFGASVAVDGNRLIVGGNADDGAGDNAGKVWVFERADAASPFTLVNQLVAGDASAYDEFGLNVAMSGDRYLIGARLADARITVGQEMLTISQWGAAYLFEGSGDSISQVQKLDGDIENKAEIGTFGEYGWRVAINGDFAVVGAPNLGKDPGVNDESTGRAYVFHRNDQGTADPSDDSWSLIATLAPPLTDDDYDDYFGYGVALSEDGETVAVGANYHEAGGSNQGAVYVFQWNAGTQSYDLKGRVRAENRTDGDEYGRQVALNEEGSVLVVGSWLDDDNATNAGAVFVYDVRGSTWTDFFAGAPVQEGILGVDSDGIKLQAATPETEARLGRAVAISGTTIVAGAYLANTAAGNDSGAAYVFDYIGGTWVQTAELNASNAGTSDQFGIDVDIDGNTIIVGAYAEDSNTDGTGNTIGDSGAAYIFEKVAGNWEETKMLKAQEASYSDQFGINVGVDGDVVVVGAHLVDANGADSGAVYVFERDTAATHGTDWAQTQVMHSPYGGAADNFGRAVDVANGVVIAGAPNADRVLADGTVIKAYGGVHSWQVSPANRGTGGALSITGVGTPARGSVTTDGSTVTFNPGNDFDFLNPGESASETFTYTVQAAGGGTATGQITVTVTGKNDSPVAVDDALSASEDGPTITGNLLTNDVDDDAGSTLTIVQVNGQTANVGVPITLASGALLTVNADGSYTYDPNGKFDSLGQGQSATDSFTYQITDSSAQVIYQAINSAFVGEAENFSARAGTGGNFWQVIGEGTPWNVNGFTGSREGTFLQVPDGAGALQTPMPGFLGQPSVSYQVEVTEAGTYELYVRAAGFDGNSDSFYAAILNKGDNAYGGAADWYRVSAPNGAFQWVGSGAPESTNASDPGVPMTFTLSEGIHTIVFSPREDGVAIDSWMLRKSDSSVPAPAAADLGPNAQQVGTVTITIDGVNDAPTAIQLSNASVDENSAGAVIGNLSASDPDTGSSHSFSVDDSRFEVVAGQLKLKSGQSLNFESEPAVTLHVTATDNGSPGLTFTDSFTVTVNNVNEAPTAVSLSNASVDENSAGAVIGNLSASDPDAGSTHSFSVDDSRFEVVAGQLKLKSGQSLNFESEPAVTLQVTATDNGSPGLAFTDSFTVTVKDVNEAPAPANATVSLAETSSNGTVIHTVAPNDPDAGDTHTFVITGGNTNNTFAINGSGEIAVHDSSQLAYGQTYNLAVQVRDQGGTGQIGSATITVNVSDVDTPPTAVTLTNAVTSRPEGTDTSGSLKVADIIITDDGSGTNLLSLAGADSARFSISGTELFLNDGVLDFDTQTTYNVIVNVDGVGVGNAVDASANFVFSVTNVAPTAQVIGTNTGVEGSQVNLTASGTDPGPSNETLSFAWSVSKNGTPGFASGTGAAIRFTPNDNGTYIVSLTATDPAGLTSAPVTHTVTVSNANPVPSIAGTTEGVEGTAVTLTASATDPAGANDTLSYSWAVSKNGTPGFAAGTGTVIGFTPDDDGSYLVSLVVSDEDGGSAYTTHTVNVVNVAPTGVNDNGGSTGEDTPFTTTNVLANDTDPAGANDPLAVQSVDATSANGALVTNNGDGTFGYDPNGKFESLAVGESATDTFSYVVSDGDGGTSTATVTVTIIGANDAPTAHPDAASTDQNSLVTTGNVLLNDADVDASDVLFVSGLDTSGTLGLVVYNGDGTFTYDPNGQFTSLGVGEAATDSFTYTASDGHGGSVTETVTITVHGLNDTPSVDSASASIDENSPNGTPVLTVSAADPDAGGAAGLVYAITDGDPGGAFAIDSATGVITVADSTQLDYESTPVFNLRVSATDLNGAGLTALGTVTVNLNDLSVSQSLIEVYQAYSLTVFNADDVSLGGSGSGSSSLFLGTIPGSVMEDVYAMPGGPDDQSVILDELLTSRPIEGNATVLAGYSDPGSEVRFSVTNDGGELVSSGSGTANSQGTFLVMLNLQDTLRLSGGTSLVLEFSNRNGTVESVVIDLSEFSSVH